MKTEVGDLKTQVCDNNAEISEKSAEVGYAQIIFIKRQSSFLGSSFSFNSKKL